MCCFCHWVSKAPFKLYVDWNNAKPTVSLFHPRTNWASTFLVTKTFLMLRSTIGAAAVFWLYALLCAAGLLFVIVAVPETRGRWKISPLSFLPFFPAPKFLCEFHTVYMYFYNTKIIRCWVAIVQLKMNYCHVLTQMQEP